MESAPNVALHGWLRGRRTYFSGNRAGERLFGRCRRRGFPTSRGEHITKVLWSCADGDEDVHRQLHRPVGRLPQRRSFRGQLV